MSFGPPATPVDGKPSALSGLVEGSKSAASSVTLMGEQKRAGTSSLVEEATSSACPALVDRTSAGPFTAIEEQLRKQVASLKDEIRQLRLSQDTNREAVKHTLLQEELAQLREKNLNLCVELRVAQGNLRLCEAKFEKQQVLESQHERCRQLMRKAVDDLSTGLDPQEENSPTFGPATEAVPSGGSPLPQQTVRPVAKASRIPDTFHLGEETHPSNSLASSTNGNSPIQTNIVSLPPSHPLQPIVFPPNASQTSQPHSPKPPFSDISSSSIVSLFHSPITKSSSPATYTPAGSPYAPLDYKSAPCFGDPEPSIQEEGLFGRCA